MHSFRKNEVKNWSFIEKEKKIRLQTADSGCSGLKFKSRDFRDSQNCIICLFYQLNVLGAYPDHILCFLIFGAILFTHHKPNSYHFHSFWWLSYFSRESVSFLGVIWKTLSLASQCFKIFFEVNLKMSSNLILKILLYFLRDSFYARIILLLLTQNLDKKIFKSYIFHRILICILFLNN